MICTRVPQPRLQSCFTFLCFLLLSTLPVLAQTGSLHGTVADPTGAVIPSAMVTATGLDGTPHTATSTSTGAYAIDPLAPGHYTVAVTATGFAAFAPVDVQVFSERVTTKNLTLKLPVDVQQVQVTSQAAGLDVSSDNNAGAIVIKGKDLDALSDDPDDLQNELTALAGPAAGPNGGQIYIDGFSGGQLPPKSSIREIRINQNPFSAQYDKLGYGRIEILTKPGTDKLRGMFMMNGNDSVTNSLNPFVKSEPPYYSTFMMANAGGPLTATSSWFANLFRRSNQSNAIINAQRWNSTTNSSYNYTAAVSNPQTRLMFSPRFDLQLGQKDTLTVRYSYSRQTDTGDGVSGTSLESQAYNVRNQENLLQISDSHIINEHTVNETRFQYSRDRDDDTPASTLPTVNVSGSFTDGGSSAGTSRTNDDQFELQNYTLISKGAHALNFGGRLRVTREASYTTSGFNGTFTYDGSRTSTGSISTTSLNALNDYAAHLPAQYTVTAGNNATLMHYWDLGVWALDDFKFKQNLTLSYGVRYETQSAIGDYSNIAPRISFAWAPGAKNGKPAKTVFRGGYGWFYDRFGASNIVQTIRQNGVNQQQYIVTNPGFYEGSAVIPTAASLATQSTSTPTIYTLGPNLKAAVSMQAAIGIEHQFGKAVTFSATYINSHGVHQFLTDNINAYSTYDYDTKKGTRPNKINENIYQYQSGGVFNQNQLMMNYSVRASKVSLFGFYMLGNAKSDTSGAGSFPSNPTNPGADYGRAGFDIRQRFLLGGNYTAPFGISISPMMDANAGSPFNITTGTDLNGDNQYNDRPAYATSESKNTVATAYGTFDLRPAWAAQRIPINVGTGPAQFALNMRVSKSVGIGPKVSKSQAAFSGGGPGGGGPPPGGGGGGLGPGGLSGSRGGPPKLDQDTARRYALNFGVMAHNIFNNVNMAAPNGALNSQLFGKSTSLAGGFFGSQAANRSIDFQVSFNF
jgi:hypothetical protein